VASVAAFNYRGFREPVFPVQMVWVRAETRQTLNCHHTVGIDLVAMCVNDVLTAGAEPLFYLATGKLNPEQLTQVVGYQPRVSNG